MKGLSQQLRDLAPGEQITVSNTERSDIHKTAKRIDVSVKIEKFAGGFYVTRLMPQSLCTPSEWAKQNDIGIPISEPDRAEVPMTHAEKLANLRMLQDGVMLGHKPLVAEPETVEEDWRFTKLDKPQYGDDGNVYRKQVLHPLCKRTRTVRVEEDGETVMYVM